MAQDAISVGDMVCWAEVDCGGVSGWSIVTGRVIAIGAESAGWGPGALSVRTLTRDDSRLWGRMRAVRGTAPALRVVPATRALLLHEQRMVGP